MKRSNIVAIFALALSLASCDFGSGASDSATNPRYTDVPPTNLTKADKSFLARLTAASGVFDVLSKSTLHVSRAVTGIAARKLTSPEIGCSPRIRHDEVWISGGSTANSETSGSHPALIDDTTTTYDAGNGMDVTCDPYLSYMGTGSGTRSVYRQAMVEDGMLTTSMGGSMFSRMDTVEKTLEFSTDFRGKIRYADGFIVVVDSATFHVLILTSDPTGRNPVPSLNDYHLTFEGYPYSATLRYNKADDATEGDIVHGGERIGTLTVFRDNTMAVLDLDGNPIKP